MNVGLVVCRRSFALAGLASLTALGAASASVAGCSSGNNTGTAACIPSPLAMQDFPGLPGWDAGGLPGLPGSGGTGGNTTIEAVSDFGANPGNLALYVHAPASGTANAIVVALHGCTQSAADYVNAGWNDVADRLGLVVVYPQTSSANNMNRCFNWFEPGDTTAGQGEAQSIASMVDYAKGKYGASRTFVTGLSAGGAMAAALLAAYPETFEAGAIMAGIPAGCASSTTQAFTCMSGQEKSASEWGSLAGSSAAASPPRVSIWQGDADYTVRPANGEALVRQWSAVNGVSDTTSETATEGRAKHSIYRDGSGVARVELWELSGMGHGVALDPKSGCGKAGAYALDIGVCSTEKAAEFFLGVSARPGSTSGGASSSGGSDDANPCP